MKKAKIIFLSALIIIIIVTVIKYITSFSREIKFTDPMINKVINNTTGLRDQLSQTTIDKYRHAVEEIKSINTDFKTKGCNISGEKIEALADDLRLLKEPKQAIKYLQKRLSCNNLSGETKFNLLSSLAFIENQMGDNQSAIKHYNQIIQEFSGNMFPYFGLSQEELIKQEIDNLKRN